MILTAKEFAEKAGVNEEIMYEVYQPDVQYLMIEFAKLHVEAALETAADNSAKLDSTKDTVRKSYDLSNIR